MRDDERRKAQLERLERQRDLVNERLDRQRQRINEQFDREQARMFGSLNEKQARIVEAALGLLDREGLESLSLRKLAGELGLKAPALYWHFKNKESLIDYMAEAILQSEFGDLEPRAGSEPWQDWLVETCKRLRSAMNSRRDGARVVAGAHLFPALTLAKLFDVSQRSLVTAGLDERRALLVVTTAIFFTFGRVIEEQSSPTQEEMEHYHLPIFLEEYPYFASGVRHAFSGRGTEGEMFEEALRLICR